MSSSVPGRNRLLDEGGGNLAIEWTELWSAMVDFSAERKSEQVTIRNGQTRAKI